MGTDEPVTGSLLQANSEFPPLVDLLLKRSLTATETGPIVRGNARRTCDAATGTASACPGVGRIIAGARFHT